MAPVRLRAPQARRDLRLAHRSLPLRPACSRHRAGELACEIPLIVSQPPEALAPVAAQFGVPYRVFPIAPTPRPRRRRSRSQLLARERDRPGRARALHADPLAAVRRALRTAGSSTSTTRSCPRSCGGKPYHQAHERGVKLIGATAHYATKRPRRGPDHRAGRDPRLAPRHGRRPRAQGPRRGANVLARAVRWHLEDRVLVYGNKTVVFS